MTDPAWLQVLASNGGCHLPCWIGIQVGETEFAELGGPNAEPSHYGGLSPSVRGYWLAGYCDSWQSHGQTVVACNLTYHVFEKSGLIVGMDVNVADLHTYPPQASLYDASFTHAMQRYSLYQVFSELGIPSEIYFDLGLSHYPNFYDMYVFYDELDLALIYSGMGVTDFFQGEIRVCPTYADVLDMNMIFQSSASGFSVLESRYESLVESIANGEMRRFPDQTDMSLDEFYGAIIENQGVVCFWTPDHW